MSLDDKEGRAQYQTKSQIFSALCAIEFFVFLILSFLFGMSDSPIYGPISLVFIPISLITLGVIGYYDGKLKEYEERKRKRKITPSMLNILPEGRTDTEIHSKLLQNIRQRLHYQVRLNPDAITGKCIVCKLSIHTSDELLECPHCFMRAHETHLLEWLKVKGMCPNCRTRIDTN